MSRKLDLNQALAILHKEDDTWFLENILDEIESDNINLFCRQCTWSFQISTNDLNINKQINEPFTITKKNFVLNGEAITPYIRDKNLQCSEG